MVVLFTLVCCCWIEAVVLVAGLIYSFLRNNEIMSTKNSLELEGGDDVCACCGIAAVDDIQLKICDGGCDLVKYCSDGCQALHEYEHAGACRKRKEELHDKKIFEQPDGSYLGECPICCLPLPIDKRKSTMMVCCCKVICNGCFHANQDRESKDKLKQRCVFCREPLPDKQDEADEYINKRLKKKDPVAMTYMGRMHADEEEYEKALEYYIKAADMGHADALHCLGALYYNGTGVEKDVKKAIPYLEKAAIGGQPGARIILANYEMNCGRERRAVEHIIINANLGCEESLQHVKTSYIRGICSKEDYAAALRGYQAAINEEKSAERQDAEVKRPKVIEGRKKRGLRCSEL